LRNVVRMTEIFACCDRCGKFGRLLSMKVNKNFICRECFDKWAEIWKRKVEPILKVDQKLYQKVWDRKFKEFLENMEEKMIFS